MIEQTVPKNQSVREKLGMSAGDFQEMGKIGALFYHQGNLEKARTVFEGLVELDPNNADAHAAMGALLTRTQENDKQALAHLHRAVELKPKQIAPYVNLGEIYIRQQKLEEAVANLKKAIELDPKEADPGANRARAMVLGIYQILNAQNITVESVNKAEQAIKQ